MLVLTRKKDEEIVIGENHEATVRVLEIRGDKVRLGVMASPAIPVNRGEVQDRIDAGETRKRKAS